MHPQFEDDIRCAWASGSVNREVRAWTRRDHTSAGGHVGTSRLSFLLYDAGGSALWAGAYISGGFIFAKELDKVVEDTSVFAGTLLLVLGAPLLLFFTWKLVRLLHMIRQLEPLYITAERLKERLDSGETIGILDLLRYEDDPEGVGAIPGAVRVEPKKMRRGQVIRVPGRTRSGAVLRFERQLCECSSCRGNAQARNPEDSSVGGRTGCMEGRRLPIEPRTRRPQSGDYPAGHRDVPSLTGVIRAGKIHVDDVRVAEPIHWFSAAREPAQRTQPHHNAAGVPTRTWSKPDFRGGSSSSYPCRHSGIRPPHTPVHYRVQRSCVAAHRSFSSPEGDDNSTDMVCFHSDFTGFRLAKRTSESTLSGNGSECVTFYSRRAFDNTFPLPKERHCEHDCRVRNSPFHASGADTGWEVGVKCRLWRFLFQR